MIKIPTTKTKIEIVTDNKPEPKQNQDKVKNKSEKKQNKAKPIFESGNYRPDVVSAKVYKLKSAFVKNSVFITLGYFKHNDVIRPIEIFINSKDLTRAPEYVVLTRLISAIFRRSPTPFFILEELRGIFDPNGGSFKAGKYYHSFYAEIADVIEQFFFEVGILDQPHLMPASDNGVVSESVIKNVTDEIEKQPFDVNSLFKICPECSSRTLKIENGCDICVDPDCGYSKCDK